MTSIPSNVTVPAVAGRRPLTTRSTVDLPAPLVPRRATTSPSETSRSTPNRTGTLPYAASTPRQRERGRARRGRSPAVTDGALPRSSSKTVRPEMPVMSSVVAIGDPTQVAVTDVKHELAEPAGDEHEEQEETRTR